MQRKFQLGDKVMLLLIALPGILHFIIFRYIPLGGNIIAFQDYNMFQGFLGSPFVGFKHFVTMFTYDEFFQILKNSILLSLYSIIFGFPAPLILALLLNEVRSMWFKRPVQTLLYMPHFLSWVIVGGIFINLLATKGFVNQFLGLFGMGPYDFVTMPEFFRPIVISVSIWKEIGWGTILYLAALTAINPSLYEAAMVDGANRWRRMWHITLPSLLPTIMVLFLLRIGSVLEANVEQVLIFQNPLNRSVAEIIDTYVYRVGLLSAQFSFSTAIGMFQALVGFILIMLLNQVSKRTTGESIY
ncbi:ABC transporter permease [Paenibacillus contaminans]|uniref:Sugar ABC transporter permease n=1 Tax=Paenibacillus contaminans TaxID=450362 RepID=A0A329MSB6_9BACL|nr:ABC transporter permease subunit [Paenibacillus contaminans]RAV22246.1 sugar ABC transporter permease [Paenibacillus contaminans]